ncbi:PREDICTED: transcription termination factor 3, mitochondrial-like [Priapulus caudatus]|uniref:Transcription termination factor 3, mitochondrial-like n=1 Tax=Priapulus caudatus TaxID=37621 RepID=A0ABM1E9B9_PRICU|nr:PREDICTED: transcription termination factor 3, mitochondrial-like [Priapulus caudatus]
MASSACTRTSIIKGMALLNAVVNSKNVLITQQCRVGVGYLASCNRRGCHKTNTTASAREMKPSSSDISKTPMREDVPFNDGTLQQASLSDKGENLPSLREKSNGVKLDVGEVDIDLDELVDRLPKQELDLSEIRPVLKTSFTLAAYVNESTCLQHLVKMGVDLHKCEKTKGAADLLVALDFEKDVKVYIQFLSDIGLTGMETGAFISQNPLILKEDLDDLQIRLNYFHSKKFTTEAITRIAIVAPRVLSMTTRQIDGKLGYIQKDFHLSGNEVRSVVTTAPKILLWPVEKIKVLRFTVQEECGFSKLEMKQMLLLNPKIWMTGNHQFKLKFDYLHNTMGISHSKLVQWPNILHSRQFIVKQRHLFLSFLGRNQYDHTKPNYVSLKALVSGTDGKFCSNIAKVSLEEFHVFLKTL